MTWPLTFPNLLVTSSYDGSCAVWNVNTEERVYQINNHASPVTCIDAAPGSPLRVAFAVGGTTYEWTPSQGKRSVMSKGSGKVTVVQWNPTMRRGDMIAVGKDDGRVDIVTSGTKGWRTEALSRAKGRSSEVGAVSDVRWDPLSHVYLLVLYSCGTVAVWDTEGVGGSSGSSSRRTSNSSGRSPLISLFDRCCVVGTSGIAWMPWEPGNFMTVGTKSGVVSVWNVSSVETTVHTARLSRIPMCFLHRLIDRSHLSSSSSSPSSPSSSSPPLAPVDRSALCSFVDGSVGLVDMERRRVVWKSYAGHRETIFDVDFHPLRPNVLATGSYDGTIKLWDTDDMSLLGKCDVRPMEIRNQQQKRSGIRGVPLYIVYSLSWQRDGTGLCAGLSGGQVQVWEIEIPLKNKSKRRRRNPSQASSSFASSGSSKMRDSSTNSTTKKKIRTTLRHATDIHSGSVYCVDWSPVILEKIGSKEKKGLLATSSKDGRLSVSTPTGGDVLCSYRHPGAVYGCSWNSLYPNVLASTCEDGHVRIFECSRHNGEVASLVLLHTLRGHTSSTFRCAWSPHHPDILATGSNDRTIKIWDVKASKGEKVLSTLCGHRDKVRALAWSHEYPEILLSGSWDSTIRVWNTMSSTCLDVCKHHNADVYGLASHPSRPFLYVSTSRDTTLRMFCLDSPSVVLSRIHSLLGLSWDTRLLENPDGRIEDLDRGKERARKVLGGNGGGGGERETVVVDRRLEVVGMKMCGSRSKEMGREREERGTTRRRFGRRRRGSGGNEREVTHREDVELMFNTLDFYGASVGLHDLRATVMALLSSLRKGDDDNGKVEEEGDDDGHETMNFSSSAVGNRTCRPLFLHVDRVVDCAKKRAASLVRFRGGTAHYRNPHEHPPLSIRDRIDDAVDLLCKVGDLEGACEILVSDGTENPTLDPHIPEWDRACALAPGVSLEYWRRLCERRVAWLGRFGSCGGGDSGSNGGGGGSGALVPSVGLEKERECCRVLSSLGDVNGLLARASNEPWNVLLLHRARGEGLFQRNQVIVEGAAGEKERGGDLVGGGAAAGGGGGGAAAAKTAAESVALTYRHNGLPLRAACCHLSVGDVMGALEVLVDGHELEVAMVVALSLDQIDVRCEDYLVLITERLVRYRLEPTRSHGRRLCALSQQLLEIHGPTRRTMLLLQEICGRTSSGEEKEKKELFVQMSMRTMEEYESQGREIIDRLENFFKKCSREATAMGGNDNDNDNDHNDDDAEEEEEEEEEDGLLVTALRYLSLGGSYQDCARLGIKRLYQILTARSSKSSRRSAKGAASSFTTTTNKSEWDILQILTSLNLLELQDQSLARRILLLSMHYGTVRALLKQHDVMVQCFFRQTRIMLKRISQEQDMWPVKESDALLEEARYMLRRGKLEEVARVVGEYRSGGVSLSASFSSSSSSTTTTTSCDLKFANMEEILMKQGVPVHTSRSTPDESCLFSPRPEGKSGVEGKTLSAIPGEMSVHTSSLEEFISRAEPLAMLDDDDNDEERARLNERKKSIAFGSSMGTRNGTRPILVSGQTLPSGHHVLDGAAQRVSCLTQLPISGRLIVLEDKSSWMTLSEAIEYDECSSFSPLLTGSKIPLL